MTDITITIRKTDFEELLKLKNQKLCQNIKRRVQDKNRKYSKHKTDRAINYVIVDDGTPTVTYTSGFYDLVEKYYRSTYNW